MQKAAAVQPAFVRTEAHSSTRGRHCMPDWQPPLAPHCDSVSPQQVSPAVAQ